MSLNLHEAMTEVLQRHGGTWVHRDEIARVIAAERLFTRPSDGQPPPSDQLRLRARKYRHIFECSDTACTLIRLRGGPEISSDAVRREKAVGPRKVPEREATAASLLRTEAAAKYKPDEIRLLIVAETPPEALDRYFYFEDVREQDSLFRYVVRGILKVDPTREGKAALLATLCRLGVYLIDLKPDPTTPSTLAEETPGLIQRIEALDPDAIVLVKATVYDTAFESIRAAGLPVVDLRIPFPGSGRQREFEAAFTRALAHVSVDVT